MAPFTNQTKNVSTQANQNFSGLTAWASSLITWANAGLGWASLKSTAYVNGTKNTSTLTNQTKN